MDLLRLNWEATVAYCGQLAAMLGSYRPEVIVGISRGGLVPARIISDIIGVNSMGILGISFYKAMGKTDGSPIITQDLTMDLKGKRVLVVDDIADTGRSLLAAKDYIARKGVKEMKVATIHYKPHSILKPDYFIAETTAWVVYPWEIHEVERELKKKKSLG
jgi:hypothetical protein